MDALLKMKVVPVLNGNDVVSPTPQKSMNLRNVGTNTCPLYHSSLTIGLLSMLYLLLSGISLVSLYAHYSTVSFKL